MSFPGTVEKQFSWPFELRRLFSDLEHGMIPVLEANALSRLRKGARRTPDEQIEPAIMPIISWGLSDLCPEMSVFKRGLQSSFRCQRG